jgi:hypothetical protein
MNISDDNKQFIAIIGGMFSGWAIQIFFLGNVIAIGLGFFLMFFPIIYISVVQQYWVTMKYQGWEVLKTFIDTQKEGMKEREFYFRREEKDVLIKRGRYDAYESRLVIMRKYIPFYGKRRRIILEHFLKWEERFSKNTDWISVEGFDIYHKAVYHAWLLELPYARQVEAGADPVYWVDKASGDGGWDFDAYYTVDNVKANPEGAFKRIQTLEKSNIAQAGLISDLTQRLTIAEFNLARLSELVQGLLRAIKSIVDQARDFLADLVNRTSSLEGALRALAVPAGFPWQLFVIAVILIIGGIAILIARPEYATGLGSWVGQYWYVALIFVIIIGVLAYYILRPKGGKK